MEISFQSITSTINFENWLSAFKEINDSLLIEIDTKEQAFIAKTHNESRNIVKYGKLSFQNAGLEVVSVTGKDRKKLTLDEWNETNSGRIKVGIFSVLDKFIKVVKQFSDTENHKINIKFESGDEGDFTGTRVEFKSLTLTMGAPCADLEQFIYVSDDKFLNGIAAIENPVVFSHNAEVSKALINISNIYSVDAKKDIIDFKVVKEGNEWALHAIDFSGNSYDYMIGYLDANDTEGEHEFENIHVPVIRNNYILGTKSDGESGKIIIPGVENGDKLKICCDSFITIIASVRV